MISLFLTYFQVPFDWNNMSIYVVKYILCRHRDVFPHVDDIWHSWLSSKIRIYKNYTGWIWMRLEIISNKISLTRNFFKNNTRSLKEDWKKYSDKKTITTTKMKSRIQMQIMIIFTAVIGIPIQLLFKQQPPCYKKWKAHQGLRQSPFLICYLLLWEHAWSSGKVQDSWSLDHQYCEFEPRYSQRVCVPGQDT